MKDVKFDKKALVAAAKKRELPEKTVASFRLSSDVYERFCEACDKLDVSRTAILEELMKAFTSR